ncbi:hypothetical protein BDZ45DRAFT_403426 [Acephala macrosclerotiorum]|nr:hypothetical protein BDZ45DRAFT_403426 [Acephala macrosclerotiorum]
MNIFLGVLIARTVTRMSITKTHWHRREVTQTRLLFMCCSHPLSLRKPERQIGMDRCCVCCSSVVLWLYVERRSAIVLVIMLRGVSVDPCMEAIDDSKSNTFVGRMYAGSYALETQHLWDRRPQKTR